MKSRRKTLGLLLSLAVLSVGMIAMAASLTGRLRTALEQDKFYKPATIEGINIDINLNHDKYERDYKNQFVVLTGTVKAGALSADRKKLTLYGSDSNKVEVDTSDAVVPALQTDDTIMVYGKVVDNWGSGYTLKADMLVRNPSNTDLTATALSLAGRGTAYHGVLISDDKLQFMVPDSWNSTYVKSVEKRNGTNVYQFSLNALEPLNTEFAEAFYAFYFTYETYLEGEPKNPSDSDKKTIEKEIVKNILQDTGADSSVKVNGAKTVGGKEFHYYTVSAKGEGNKDYRLEFVFVPDGNDKGTTCLLYLYFPQEGAVHHSEEAAFVVDSLIK